MARYNLNIDLIGNESDIVGKNCYSKTCEECSLHFECNLISAFSKTLENVVDCVNRKDNYEHCENMPYIDFNGIGYIIDKADWSLIPICKENKSCDSCPVKEYCFGINNTTLGIKFTLDLMIDKIKKEAIASTL